MSNFERFLDTFFKWPIIVEYTPAILNGMLVTILIGAAVVVTGIALGLLLAVLRSYRLRILVPGTDLLADRDEALNVRYAIGLEKLEMRRDVIASIDTADYMDLIAAEEDISRWQNNFRRLDPEDYVSTQAGDD